jgi:parvulin-like peptidyl-prolyl isomerase
VIKRPRTSRFAAAFAAICLLGLSACGSVSSSTDVFSVNGSGYPQEDFASLVTALTEAGQFKPVNGALSKEDASVVLRTLIRYEAFTQFIKENDVTVKQADIDTVMKSAEADTNFASYPKLLQDLLVNFNVADVTLKSMAIPSESALESLYSKSPASAGVLCLSHILVKTEAEAKTVLADLAGGTKFADEAAKKSIEPGADKSGGALANGEEPCQALANLQSSFDKDFMIGAVAAKPGVPTGPIKSSFGYHIILSHPFSEVKQSVTTVVTENAGTTLLAGFMAAADITVNSKYGVWNGATAAIS